MGFRILIITKDFNSLQTENNPQVINEILQNNEEISENGRRMNSHQQTVGQSPAQQSTYCMIPYI